MNRYDFWTYLIVIIIKQLLHSIVYCFQIQKTRSPKKKDRKSAPLTDNTSNEDSGIAASDGSNAQSNVCDRKFQSLCVSKCYSLLYAIFALYYYIGNAINVCE